MPNRSRRLVVSALLLALAGCGAGRAPARTWDPFVGRMIQSWPPLRTVALASIRGPTVLRQTEAMRGRLLATLEARLREAGVAVVPAADVDPVVADAAAWREGFYDPRSGRLDEAKVRGAYEEVIERLSDRFGRVDALAIMSVQVVEARVRSDWAEWSGTRAYAGASGWNRVPFLGRSAGTVAALSLFVEVVGRDGVRIYRDHAGLQLLEKVRVDGSKIAVPPATLLADDEANAAAVYRATDALVAVVRGQQAAAPP